MSNIGSSGIREAGDWSLDGLGPLPQPYGRIDVHDNDPRWQGSIDGWSADQIRAYALAEVQRAVAAERERWAPLVAALAMAVRQNEHDMLMTGDELRACRAALDALGPNAGGEPHAL